MHCVTGKGCLPVRGNLVSTYFFLAVASYLQGIQTLIDGKGPGFALQTSLARVIVIITSMSGPDDRPV